ncbi:hypothetical protein [Streptomyces sp. NPDC003832]
MVYNMHSGSKVITRNIPLGKEFETRNAAGETISTVRLPHAEANELLRELGAAQVAG